MKIRRGLLNWGVFLVCLGAVPLAIQLGWLDSGATGELLRLWPLILVGIGLGLLLRFSNLAVLGGVVVAGTFGLLLGALFSGGLSSAATACGGTQADGSEVIRDGDFAAGQATVRMEFTCAQIDIGRAAGLHWSVQSVTSGGAARIDSSAGSISLRSSDRSSFFFTGDSRETWHVSLPAEPTLAISMTLNAATGTMSVGQGPVSRINSTLNASDLRLDMSGSGGSGVTTFDGTLNASSVTAVLPDALVGSLTLNASSLNLCAAPSSAIWVTYQDTLSSNNFAEAGLTGAGRSWQTPDYGSSATSHQVRLNLNANVSSITLDRSGGCR